MKFKHIMMCLAGFLLTACETVEEDERFGTPVYGEANKNVLIEDFTAQRCVNCPTAAGKVAELQNLIANAHNGKQYIIAVAIHGGEQAIAAPYGLAVPVSEEYTKAAGITAWPSAIIDHKGAPNSDFNTWGKDIISRMSEPLQAELSLTNTYDETSRTINIKVNAEAVSAAVNGTLQVWLTESGIEAYQSLPTGGHDMQYVHNHVLRDAVNGKDGESIVLEPGTPTEKTYTYALPDNWKAENMAVVAFVHNENGVLQVIESHVANH